MTVSDLSPAHIRIRRARPTDALAITDVEAQADEPDPGFQIMFGGRKATSLPARAVTVQETMRNDPAARYYVAVLALPALDQPTCPGEDGVEKSEGSELVVGVSRWHFRTNPDWNEGSMEEKDSEAELPVQWPPGANVGACNALFSWIYGARKRYMSGKAHALLSLLATRPDFQRRGVGSALIRHGLNIAEELGLPAWLEASRAGYPVYKKWGFEDMEVRMTDYSPFGREWKGKHVAMVKQVAGAGAKDNHRSRGQEKEEDGQPEKVAGDV